MLDSGIAPERNGAGDEALRIYQLVVDEAASGDDRAALSEHCDVLHELVRAMQALDSERPEDTTKKNIGIVLDHLKMAEREYVSITEAQKKKAN